MDGLRDCIPNGGVCYDGPFDGVLVGLDENFKSRHG